MTAQRPAEYMDFKESSTDDSQTQTAGQVADYTPLHPSTCSWEVSRDHVTLANMDGKGAFDQVAKRTAKEPRGRSGTTKISIKILKGKTFNPLKLPCSAASFRIDTTMAASLALLNFKMNSTTILQQLRETKVHNSAMVTSLAASVNKSAYTCVVKKRLKCT
ncbi:hypothetical protein AWC38_SpisGene11697 [Stylophora pistillata]|uniref:Uncharacterized protein n=1 Tax=Stylophora pistillata TaxID=50429 RepID=A0A2B4S3V2_STYPI|nr:hypothetical protein AWC38_SpisGene11697 [Stylophora pistillata]